MTKAIISRESIAARLWRRTLEGVGVKFGLAWVGILVFFAVFAPFVANSMPLLMSKNGNLSAPVLRYLSVEDVWILASFFIALAVYPLRLASGSKWLLLVALSMTAALVANLSITPPQLVIYEDFRSTDYTQVDWRLMPP
ncbi:MAG: hypothetical protein RL563_2517, partial [Pseudomonadota bacterium]